MTGSEVGDPQIVAVNVVTIKHVITRYGSPSPHPTHGAMYVLSCSILYHINITSTLILVSHQPKLTGMLVFSP